MDSKFTLKPSDKIVATVAGLIGLGLFGWIGITVLPILIAAATNTAIFLAEMFFLVMIPWSIWDNRDTIVLKYLNWCRSARRAVIADDPIGTLSTIIKRFEAKLEKITTHLNEAVAAKKRQANQIAEWTKKRDEATGMMNVATVPAQRERFAVAAQRWDEAVQEALPQLDLLRQMHEKMSLAKSMASEKIEDLKNEQEVLAARLDAFKANQSAANKFKSFFGSSKELDDLNLTIGIIEEQSTLAEAEIEGFLTDIAPALAADDLQKKAKAAAAIERFAPKLKEVAEPLLSGETTYQKKQA